MVLCFLDRDVPAYTLAAEGLPYYGAGFLFLAVNICAVGYLQSIEKSGSATVFTLLRGVVFLVAAYILLPRFWGTVGLWLSVPCAELLTALALIIYAFAVPVRKKHNA